MFAASWSSHLGGKAQHIPARQGAGEAPLRFWIDEYAFSEGETAILRENIDVPPNAPHCPADSPLLASVCGRPAFSHQGTGSERHALCAYL